MQRGNVGVYRDRVLQVTESKKASSRNGSKEKGWKKEKLDTEWM